MTVIKKDNENKWDRRLSRGTWMTEVIIIGETRTG